MMTLAQYIELINSQNSILALDLWQSDRQQILDLFQSVDDFFELIERASNSVWPVLIVNDSRAHIANLFKTPDDFFRLIHLSNKLKEKTNYPHLVMAHLADGNPIIELFKQSDDIVKLAMLDSRCALWVVSGLFDVYLDGKRLYDVFKNAKIDDALLELAAHNIPDNYCAAIAKLIPKNNLIESDFVRLVSAMRGNPTINPVDVDSFVKYVESRNDLYHPHRPGFFSNLQTQSFNLIQGAAQLCRLL